MSGHLMGFVTALWLGILTSISPCPLTTNIAATSFIGKKIDNPRYVFYSGLLYTLGRMITYAVLGAVLVSGLGAATFIADLLQKYMNKIIGPVLIIVGMLLLEMLSFNLDRPQLNDKMKDRIDKSGIWGAVFLGVFFALSFCPVSAGLFFGSLLTLALKLNSGILIPAFYGIGTGLPVMIFAYLLAYSAKSVGKAFNHLNAFEKWARRVTGIIFIIAGIYYTLAYIFEIF